MRDYDIVGWLPDGLPDMTRVLLERGEAGWELITVVPREAIMPPDESKAEHWWVFKRPTSTDVIG